MKTDLSNYKNDELLLIYKNQNCNQAMALTLDESYDDGGYTVYLQEYSEGCFITSAVCGSFDKPDDCKELMAFRAFRDSYMNGDESLKKEVVRYYKLAPEICKAIESNGELVARREYARIWDEYLSVAYEALNQKDYQKAYNTYRDMVLSLEKKYLDKNTDNI